MAASGYVFQGWSLSSTAATPDPAYAAGETFTITKDTVLYAIWKPQYTVTYDKNLAAATGSQTDANSPYLSGSKVTVLDQGTIAATDYIFKGWNTDQTAANAGTVQYKANDTFTISQNTTLYAVWEPKVKVTYNPNIELISGSAPVDSLSPYVSGSTVTVLGENDMKVSGFVFYGWNTDRTAAYNGAVQYAEGDTFTITQDTTLYGVWGTAPKYTVTYDANLATATGAQTDAKSPYLKDSTVTVLNQGTMAAEGYTFKGWNTDAKAATAGTVQYKADDTFTISQNTTLYAVWEALPKYTVTYDKTLAVATGSQTDAKSPYLTGSTVTVLDEGTMKADGYVFKGWNLEKELALAGTVDASNAPGQTFTITSDVTLYAVWVPLYTVTYDKNLDKASAAPTDANSPYEDGSTVTVLDEGKMKADGYTFKGWSEDKDATTADSDYDPGEEFVILGNVVLYAVWEKIPTFTVTYDKNLTAATGAQTDANSPYTTGSTVTILDQGTMAANGYSFLGWNTDQTAATAGTVQYKANDTFDITKDTTLYAVWKEIPKYTVTYHETLEIASAAPTDANSPYLSGSSVTVLDKGTMEADGYVFKGWNPDQTAAANGVADVTYDPGLCFEIGQNVDLYAAWEQLPTYTVTYDKNLATATGSQTDANSPYVTGSTVTVLDAGTMKADGYVFKGWNTNQDQAKAGTVDANYAPGQTFTITSDVTLYAAWTPVYTVTYDKNLDKASDAPVDANSPYEAGTFVTVLDQGTMEATGYTFWGWSTDKDATDGDSNYQPGGEFVLTDNVTLYAVWHKVPTHTVTYDKNLATATGSQTDTKSPYLSGSTVTVLDQGTMKADGYVFKGWKPDQGATGTDANFDPGKTFTIDQDVTLYAVWTPVYTVTYDKNLDKASDAPVDANSPYEAGTFVTVLDQGTMEATGYTFWGWSTDKDATDGDSNYQPGGEFVLTDNVTLYAVWHKVPTHTVTYDKNLATATGSQTDTKSPYLSGSTVTVLDQGTMKADGYVFKGWKPDLGSTGPNADYAPGKTFTITQDVTLYAVWAPTYTVNFDTDGGVNGPTDDNRYEAGESVKIPEGTPEKTGARFDGWTSDPTDPDAPVYQPGDTVIVTEGGVTLTAVWTDVYTVEYDPNGGSDEPKDDKKYENGEEVQVPSDIPTKKGFEFKGWSLDPSDPDAPLYQVGDTVTVNGKDITFTAVWSKINSQPIIIYSVTYDPAGGVPTPDDTTEYVDGATVIVTDDVPAKDGFTFVGWSLDPTDPAKPVLKGGDTTTIQGDNITFTAIWTPNYVVIYDKNADDATGTQKDLNNPYESGETVTVLGAGSIARTGYVFKGWAKTASETTASFTEGNNFVITADTTLYAVWEALPTYKVVYNPNGGFGEPTDDTKYDDGATVTVSATEPVKNGFIFQGWTLDPSDPDAKLLKSGDTTTIQGGDVTLTAVWKSDPNTQIVVLFKVTYDPQGGTPAPVDTTEYVDGATVIVTSDVPVKDGFVLDGWTLDPNAATPVLLGGGETTKIDGSDLTFYAVWAPVYTVDYNASGASSTPKDEKKYRNGEKAVIMADIPVVEGKTFKGWTTDPADTSNLLQNGDSVTIEGKNIILYAVFEDNASSTFTVKYDLNGGSGTAPVDPNKYGLDSSVTIVNDVPKRDGYTFTGWSLKINGSADYNGGDTYKISTDTTFYAIWTPIASGAKTGDPMQALPWVLMALLSMAGASAAMIRSKKRAK